MSLVGYWRECVSIRSLIHAMRASITQFSDNLDQGAIATDIAIRDSFPPSGHYFRSLFRESGQRIIRGIEGKWVLR